MNIEIYFKCLKYEKSRKLLALIVRKQNIKQKNE